MDVKKLYKLEVDEELRVEVDCPKNEKVWPGFGYRLSLGWDNIL